MCENPNYKDKSEQKDEQTIHAGEARLDYDTEVSGGPLWIYVGDEGMSITHDDLEKMLTDFYTKNV